MFRIETVDGQVAVLRMDDGRVNAVSPEFLKEFPAAWEAAGAGDRAVVLTGNARVFCAGLDLKALVAMSSAEVEQLARGFARVFRLPLTHPRPVVAAVNGAAIAGGGILALACDFRVAAREARVGVPEVPVGVPFPGSVLELVRQRLPPQEHAPALLQGAQREGDDLAARGWAHRVVPRAEVEAEAVALARELAASTRRAYGDTKADLNRGLVAAFERFERDEAAAWAAVVTSEEARAALRRTLERLHRR